MYQHFVVFNIKEHCLCSVYRALSTTRVYYNINYGDAMISYEPFYKTIKEKNISTYKLITQHGFSRSLIDRLRHNKPVSTVTLDDICTVLDCRIEDVIEYKKENTQSEE